MKITGKEVIEQLREIYAYHDNAESREGGAWAYQMRQYSEIKPVLVNSENKTPFDKAYHSLIKKTREILRRDLEPEKVFDEIFRLSEHFQKNSFVIEKDGDVIRWGSLPDCFIGQETAKNFITHINSDKLIKLKDELRYKGLTVDNLKAIEVYEAQLTGYEVLFILTSDDRIREYINLKHDFFESGTLLPPVASETVAGKEQEPSDDKQDGLKQLDTEPEAAFAYLKKEYQVILSEFERVKDNLSESPNGRRYHDLPKKFKSYKYHFDNGMKKQASKHFYAHFKPQFEEIGLNEVPVT